MAVFDFTLEFTKLGILASPKSIKCVFHTSMLFYKFNTDFIVMNKSLKAYTYHSFVQIIV